MRINEIAKMCDASPVSVRGWAKMAGFELTRRIARDFNEDEVQQILKHQNKLWRKLRGKR